MDEKLSLQYRVFSFKPFLKSLTIAGLIATGLGLGLSVEKANAGETALKTGRETGLPLPRFVSLKSGVVNLRVGPGRKYSITWQYRRRGLPVEIIQEFDQWRRIRDADGSTGWVLHSLLSSRRTAMVAPWNKPTIEMGRPASRALFDGKDAASRNAGTVARLQAGLIVDVSECEGRWCALEAQRTKFWLEQEQLWGVYPGEAFEG